MKLAFRIIAFLEGLSFILLLFVAVPIKYFADNETFVKLLGMPHGLLFVGYLLLAYLIKEDMQWSSKEFTWVLIAALIPFATFYIDKKYF